MTPYYCWWSDLFLCNSRFATLNTKTLCGLYIWMPDIPLPWSVQVTPPISSSLHLFILRKRHSQTRGVRRACRKKEIFLTQSVGKTTKRWFKMEKERRRTKKRSLSGELFVVCYFFLRIRKPYGSWSFLTVEKSGWHVKMIWLRLSEKKKIVSSCTI